MSKNSYIFLAITLLLFSCKKDDDPVVCETEAPTNPCADGSYCFSRDGEITVNYGGQTTRLNQLAEITTYMKTANGGTAISAAQLKEMFSNNNGTGSAFFSGDANDASKQLKSKTFLGFQDGYEVLMDAMEVASQSASAGSSGTAGVVVSTTNSSKQYLFDENGFEFTQLIEKGLMGDCFYYQAMDTYISGVEDATYGTEILDGKNYTENEHKFDETFGYLGIPTDFLTNTEDARFHGKYCNSRNSVLSTNEALFDAFAEARQAITNGLQDHILMVTPNIRLEWHRIIAGTVVHYLNAAIANIDDPALKCHELSEAYAFIGNLVHSDDAYNISVVQRDECLALLGTNFYETTTDNINDAKQWLIENTAITLIESAGL